MNKLLFNRLKISQKLIELYMTSLENGGKNPAYTHEDFPDTAFMQYQERGEVFFTMIGLEDYHRIKMEYWTGTNNYVTTCRGGKTIYLHRELCPRLQKGQYAHHKSSRFDNRPGMLEAVTPKDHDQHRTYYGDLVIDVK